MEREIPRDVGVTCLLSDPFLCRPATVAAGERRPPPGTSCNHVTRPDPTGSRKLLNFVFHHSADFSRLFISSSAPFLAVPGVSKHRAVNCKCGEGAGRMRRTLPPPRLESNQHQNRRPLFICKEEGRTRNKSDAGDKQDGTG